MTKEVELERSTYIFKDILETQGVYFALMFLVDSGYNNNEIKLIANKLTMS